MRISHSNRELHSYETFGHYICGVSQCTCTVASITAGSSSIREEMNREDGHMIRFGTNRDLIGIERRPFATGTAHAPSDPCASQQHGGDSVTSSAVRIVRHVRQDLQLGRCPPRRIHLLESYTYHISAISSILGPPHHINSPTGRPGTDRDRSNYDSLLLVHSRDRLYQMRVTNSSFPAAPSTSLPVESVEPETSTCVLLRAPLE